MRLEFTKLIEKFGLTAQKAPAAQAPAVSVTVEKVITPEQADALLAHWRKADHVSVLTLPDLTGAAVVCETGKGTAVTAELFFDQYQGDWNALLRELFSADIRKVSHNVKDLMRTLADNGLPADGFVFDTGSGSLPAGCHGGQLRSAAAVVSYYK